MLMSHEEVVRETEGSKKLGKMQAAVSRVCNDCGETFNSQQAFKHHVNRVHKPQKEYPCTVAQCTKKFKQERYLKEHMKQHDVKHTCLFCTKKFGHKKTLNRHMREYHEWQG